MCVDPEWYPFEAIRKDHHIGIAAEVMKEFEHKLGIPIRFLPVTTWQESIEHAKKRECDILSLASSTPERLKYMDFTTPYVTLPVVMATTIDKPFTEEITSLRREKLGVVKGYAILEQLKTTYPDLNLIEVESITDGLNRVESGELYGYIDNLMVVSSYIQKEHTGTLKVSSRLKEKVYLSVGIRNDDPMLYNIFETLVSGIDPVMMQNIYNRYSAVVYENNRYFWLFLYLLGGMGMVSIVVVLWNRLLQKRVKVQLEKNSEQEKLLFQKAKQAEIGNMIASISHQWREPLSQISAINLLTLSMLRQGKHVDRSELDLQCQKIEETIGFMSQTMQSFLEFYKVSTIDVEFNVYESVQGILAITETELLQYDVTVMLSGDQGVVIRGIKNEWMQIWLNLINNAIKVFKNKKIVNPVLKIHITDSRIVFCDNGRGMSFEEQNNGLGHKMCEEIAVKYNARFSLENSDEGLCASIEFKKSH